MSLPSGRRVNQGAAHRWETIRYALESNARTARLCVIMLVASIPPGLLMMLVRR
jgi:hypothetical protein